jgi:hypothetical protein
MKPILAIFLLSAVAANAAVQSPVSDGLPANTQIDLVKWGMTQGGLVIVLLVVLYWVRVDQRSKFIDLEALIAQLRADKATERDESREEKRMLVAVIEKNTAAALSQALATAANTQATQSLATNIDRLERSLKP